MGVSNYGIKKMLPRLIISALLVNSSFWIAGIAVELSNVAGESLYSLLGGTDLYSAAAAQTPNQADWVTLSDRAVMGLTVGGAVGSGLLTSSILIPILLGSALAIMIAVFVLTLRQAFIIGLIIIAPLAFVAFLLPNTEEWFKRWWKVFRTLLLLFPIIALIFGASSVASQVLTAVAATYTQPILKFVMEVMAAGVQILPLFLTTILTNVTQGTLGKLTGLVNNKNKGLIDRSKNFARDRQKYRNEATKAGYGRFGKRKSNWNPMKRAGGFGRAMDKVNRTQKTDMERFDNELETDWRSSGGGGRAIQSQMSSSQALGKVKVDAEVRSINNPNNTTLQADVEASNLSLSKAKAALETKSLTNPDLKQSRADVAASEARLSAAKTSVDADHSELAAGQNIGGYAPGTEIGMEQATDAGVYQGIRKDSAGRIANTERAERIKNSQAIQDLAGGIDPRGADRVKAYAADTQSRAEDEAVGQTISTLKSENSHEQIDKAAALLEKSLNENDEIGARAATRFLDQSAGSPGKSKLRETMEKVQNSPQGFQHPNVVQAVKAEGKSGPSTKAYDVVMDTFYNGDDSVKISTLKNTSAQIDRLKESEIVGQDKAQLRHWAANNIMSRARAQQVLDANKDHNLPIEEEKLKIFKLMASSSNPTP